MPLSDKADTRPPEPPVSDSLETKRTSTPVPVLAKIDGLEANGVEGGPSDPVKSPEVAVPDKSAVRSQAFPEPEVLEAWKTVEPTTFASNTEGSTSPEPRGVIDDLAVLDEIQSPEVVTNDEMPPLVSTPPAEGVTDGQAQGSTLFGA